MLLAQYLLSTRDRLDDAKAEARLGIYLDASYLIVCFHAYLLLLPLSCYLQSYLRLLIDGQLTIVYDDRILSLAERIDRSV